MAVNVIKGTAVDIGGEIYALYTNKPIESTYKGLPDFIRNFGNDSETKRVLLQHLPLTLAGYDYDKYKFSGTPDDKALLMNIIDGRIKQLVQSITVLRSTGTFIIKNNQYVQYLNNLRRLLDSIEKSGPGTPITQSAECKADIEYTTALKKDENKLFEMMLQISWFLLHPDKVPKDIQCDWAKLIKRMDEKHLLDIITKINKTSESNAVNRSVNIAKPLNFFKRIKFDRIKESTSLKNLEKQATNMIVTVDPHDAMKDHIDSLLYILHMKKYLKDSSVAKLSGNNIKLMNNQIIENPMAVEEEKKSVPTISNNKQKGGLVQTTNTVTATTITPVQNDVHVDKELNKYLHNGMTPLFDYFLKFYDPVYGFLQENLNTMKKDTTLKTKLPYLLPDLLRILHITNNLSNKETIYQITNVNPSVIEFIRQQLKFTTEKHNKFANTKNRNTFIENIQTLPQTSLSDVRLTMNSRLANTTTKTPYIQFFVVGENLTLIDENEFDKHSGITPARNISKGLYSATTEFFTQNNLYICVTDNPKNEKISMNLNMIDCSKVQTNNTLSIDTLSDNYFNKNKNKNTVADLTLDKLVEIKKDSIFNSAELALSILLLFRSKMPTKE